jgi:DNA-binding response OmpR family regulator
VNWVEQYVAANCETDVSCGRAFASIGAGYRRPVIKTIAPTWIICVERDICVKRILLIEDDSELCTLMQDVLQAEGYAVSVAADGQQGIALQRKQPASLLITDIFMPNKEGIETIRDFRAEFPDVPIIVMSGGGRLKRRGSVFFTAKELGAVAILRKPFEMSHLLKSVAAVLDALEL